MSRDFSYPCSEIIINQVYRVIVAKNSSMKKTVLILAVSFLLFGNTGCVKDTSCTPRTVQSEQGAILNYALSNGINATAHSTGLYYEVINPGSGTAPDPNSTISVTYTGQLLDGTVFETKTTPVQLALSQAINGWQIGLPLIQEGGTIKLIIPSSLAFGCTGAGNGAIPRDAVLYFEITLVDVL